jgi:soluble lytic murein transglycosylase-like protein
MFPTPLIGIALLVACSSPLPPPSSKVDQTKTLVTTTVNSSEIAKHFPRCVPYLERIRQEANRVGVRPNMFLGLIIYESGCNPNAISKAGAVGLGQVMPDYTIKGRPSTAALKDPDFNLMWSANILRGSLNLYSGCEAQGLSRYNGSAVKGCAQTAAGKRYSDMVYTMEAKVRAWKVFPP